MSDKPEVRLYADFSKSYLKELAEELENVGWKVKRIRTSVVEPQAFSGTRYSKGVGDIRRDFINPY